MNKIIFCHRDTELLTMFNITPPDKIIYLSKIEIYPGISIDVYNWGEFLLMENPEVGSQLSQLFWKHKLKIDKETPIQNLPTIEVISNAYTKKITLPSYRNYYGKLEEDDAYYENRYRDSYQDKVPFLYLKLKISLGDFNETVETKFRQPRTNGKANLGTSKADLFADFFGYPIKWSVPFDLNSYYHWENFHSVIKGEIVEPIEDFWYAYFLSLKLSSIPDKGVKGAENKKQIKTNLDKLKDEKPVLYKFYQWLHNDKTVGGISNNSLLSAMLLSVGDNYETLEKELQSAMDRARGPDGILKYPEEITRKICLSFSASKEKDEKRREHSEWYLKKTNAEKVKGIGVDADKHPKLLSAVENGDIPLSVFHNPGNQLQLVNVEFDLWEKALSRKGWSEVLFQIAKSTSRRSTYNKYITPYLSFLFMIESYLDKHTKAKRGSWKAMPKYVSSQWELEMQEQEGQTAKRRSALTPLADNEAKTITVPYAAIAIGGHQTTYCYSSHYYVFQENMIDPESKSVVSKDLEEKLNGKDDYGLMFYTLDGTARNQGYPTFLIIFERRKKDTFVHFHRVHPSRLKNGIEVPACRLIEECYRYMAGNIRAEEIAGQQGDLLFIRDDNHKSKDISELSALEQAKALSDVQLADLHALQDKVKGKKLLEFESHQFVSLGNKPVVLEENTTSIKNRLGFIYCDSEIELRHPEHEMIKLSAGWYEVRRCKSYENNPVAVWSYTID